MKGITTLFAVATVAATAALPSLASADRWHDRHEHKEQWKNVAIASGVVGLIGAATHNSTLAAVGLGGALYGGVRYEGETRYDGYGRYERHRWNDRRRDDRGWEDRRDDRRGDRYGR